MKTPPVLYHAARQIDRTSIERLGLLARGELGGPRRPKWAIAGQPSAVYAVPSIDAARDYVAHFHDRFLPWWRSANPQVRHEHLERLSRMRDPQFANRDWDIWEIRLAGERVERDADWPGEAYAIRDDVPPARIRRVAEWSLALEGDRAASA